MGLIENEMKQLDLFTRKDSEFEDKSLLVVPHFDTPEDLESFIEKLKVVDIGLFYLGEKIKKRPISPNYRGLCPFHQERTPSFYLKPKQNRYVCYGCGTSGGPLNLDYKLGQKMYANIVKRVGLEHLPSIVEMPYLLSTSDGINISTLDGINNDQRRYIEVISEAFEKE